MTSPATELSRQLSQNAETVCRHYLSSGRKQGHYWLVGDVHNTPGRSMFVRLSGPLSGNRAAGKWTDAATGQHGDLLDVIRESCGLLDFKDVVDEARRFLSLPLPDPPLPHSPRSRPAAATGSQEAARRLFAMGVPIYGTPVETYLRGRGIGAIDQMPSLRFHPACFYRPEGGGPVARLPAMLAAITDLEGRQTGTHRTWLRPDGSAKADIDTPRRAMGALLGNGCGSARPQTCSSRARGSRRFFPCARPCLSCPPSRRCHRDTWPPSGFPLACGGSTCCATVIPQARRQGIDWRRVQPRLGSRR